MATTNVHITSNVVLRVKELCKTFGGQKILDNLSLELTEGEIVILRGENGAGKTTLLNILSGNFEPDSGSIEICTNGVSEHLKFPSPWWEELNPFNHFTPERLARESIGRTWQDVRLFNTFTLRDNIAVATPNQMGENPFWALLRPELTSKQEKTVIESSESALARLGLAGRELSSADRISLGQSKRVAIARAIQAGAKILFLDEPLAGLDSQGIKEVLDFLKEMVAHNRLTLVIVEHAFNLPHILNMASTVWTLNSGRLVQNLPNETNFEKLDATINSFKHWLSKDRTNSHEELLKGATLTKIELKKSDTSPSAVAKSENESSANNDTVILEVTDLIVYRGERLVIGEIGEDGKSHGLSFTLRKGEITLLQAPNGWGKSTLLEALAGVLPIPHGTIKLNGKSIQSLKPWQRFALGLSFLQSRDNTYQDLTAGESLWLASISDIPDDIVPFAAKKMSELSGGQKQKVVTRCVLDNPGFSCALLDEPFSALDDHGIKDLTNLLQSTLSHAAILIAIPAANAINT
jgi:ABC-type branched-subunit amino acid transport system ATPase component